MTDTTLVRNAAEQATPLQPELRIAGLDGVRALAVLAVLVFHFWPDVLPGGFLGVTLFFSLSGYLLTVRLLREREATGSTSIRGFYARRARRLLPASLLTIALIVVVWYALDWYTRDIANGATGALFQVTNWVEIAKSQAYGTTSASNPFVHFWSLAIEEQFYWIFPVLAAVCVTRVRWATVLGAGFVASVVVTRVNSGDSLIVYYSTFTRVGEILAGALLALALHGRTGRVGAFTRRAATPVALIGIAGFVVLCTSTSLDTASYYQGALLAVGVLAGLTVAAVAHSALCGRGLDTAVFKWIGERSYGVYLFHWPVIVMLREKDVAGAPYWALLITFALTAVSFRFLETPIRRRRLLRRRPLAALVPAVVLLAIVPQILPTTPVLVGGIDFAAAAELAEAGGASTVAANPVPTTTAAPATTTIIPATVAAAAPTTSVATPGPVTAVGVAVGSTVAEPATDVGPTSTVTVTTVAAPVLTGPVRYAVIGDSKALTLGLAADFADGQELENVATWGRVGCPLGRGGRVRSSSREGEGKPVSDGCDWRLLPAMIVPYAPLDVALVYSGAWDLEQRQIPALGDNWTSMSDPAYRAWLYAEILAFVDYVHDQGVAHVALMTIFVNEGYDHGDEYFAAWNQMLYDAAKDRPGVVDVIDLAGWLTAQPDFDRLIPDGTHLTYEPNGGTGLEVMNRFLIAAIHRVAGR